MKWANRLLIGAEVYDLYQKSLILQIDKEDAGTEGNSEQWQEAKITTQNKVLALLDLTSIVPNYLQLTEMGKRVSFLMQLETLPDEDIRRVAETLR